jgi:ATP-dependent helicase/nuclease subunit A
MANSKPGRPLRETGADASSPALHDDADRQAATDPNRNVVLEASAGTGKTRVLVDRYVNLLSHGVEPLNILAMTFTRKAAAEMRERIVATLRERAKQGGADEAACWQKLRDRLSEISISTIDAFCLNLLREFPLEADLDPGFDVADETNAPRLIEESLDATMRACRARARHDEEVALLYAQLGEVRLRKGLGILLGQRMVAEPALNRVLARGPHHRTIAQACEAGAQQLARALESAPDGLETFLKNGPVGSQVFDALAAETLAFVAAAALGGTVCPPDALRIFIDQLNGYFFTKGHTPRKQTPAEYKGFFPPGSGDKAYWVRLEPLAAAIDAAEKALRRDLNGIQAYAVRTVFNCAVREYERTLEAHGLLDFTELLRRTLRLLGNMEEFACSRYLLESRYRHVLVDEFQDTSRAQWELVGQLIRAWGEGAGPAEDAIKPSIFIVGDRKQSIYGFRNADVSLLDEATEIISGLRPGMQPCQTITHNFRSVPQLLAFANDLFAEVDKKPERADRFRYDERDRFPHEPDSGAGEDIALGIVAAGSDDANAAAVADEVVRILGLVEIRDKDTKLSRPAAPSDVAILFRTRKSHRAFEQALEDRGVSTYVYKGLGFFDSDEVQDVVALLRYLGDPQSDLRAAAFLRSRFVRLSDPALQQLAPVLARSLSDAEPPAALANLDDEDRRVMERARASAGEWLALVDAVPPAELLDQILAETAFAYEWRGRRAQQARENVKKLRTMVRRIQNRGYLTMSRLAEQLDLLSAGDESNAVVEALNAVSLMTIHAAKGLEFPVVFLVSLQRGTGGFPDPIRVSANEDNDEPVAIGDFRTETDDDLANRDAEESKRLLYVAVTRARDRLYLSANVKDGAVKAGPGSLMSVCPESVRELFGKAATDTGAASVEWHGSSGRPHVFVVCRPPVVGVESVPAESVAAEPPAPSVAGNGREAVCQEQDFAPLEDRPEAVRLAVTEMVGKESRARRTPTGPEKDRLYAGSLVHRLFQFGQGQRPAGAELCAWAERLLEPEEREGAHDPEAVVVSAVRLYEQLCDQDNLRQLLESATCFYEVPFSLWVDGAEVGDGGTPPPVGRVIVRGVMDCVALVPDGRAVIVDFKTGTPRPRDQAQMEVYLRAARGLFADRTVTGMLVYEASTSVV